jgi:hypothetical protein
LLSKRKFTSQEEGCFCPGKHQANVDDLSFLFRQHQCVFPGRKGKTLYHCFQFHCFSCPEIWTAMAGERLVYSLFMAVFREVISRLQEGKQL